MVSLVISMLDDVFNYTNQQMQLSPKVSGDQRLTQALTAIEQALIAIAKALETIKVLQQESVQQVSDRTPVQEISAHKSILTKETLATSFVEFKSSSVGPISSDQKIVEGTFNGESMVDTEGKAYSIPANYASKSKLVEGDGMKLIITQSGSFVYKQIAPVERQRLIGTLEQSDIRGEYCVRVGDRRFRVLTASITYYKGFSGDEVIILVPKGSQPRWAAVENIIKRIP